MKSIIIVLTVLCMMVPFVGDLSANSNTINDELIVTTTSYEVDGVSVNIIQDIAEYDLYGVCVVPVTWNIDCGDGTGTSGSAGVACSAVLAFVQSLQTFCG